MARSWNTTRNGSAMGKTRLAPLGWKKGPFLTVRPAGKKRQPKRKHATGPSFTKPRSPDYQEYLAGDRWRNLKVRYAGAKACCCACKFKGSLTLHHISYERLGREATGDLIVLCHPCHHRLHAFFDRTMPDSSTSEKAAKTAHYFKQALGVTWKPGFAFQISYRT